jgi:hypothetical protein
VTRFYDRRQQAAHGQGAVQKLTSAVLHNILYRKGSSESRRASSELASSKLPHGRNVTEAWMGAAAYLHMWRKQLRAAALRQRCVMQQQATARPGVMRGAHRQVRREQVRTTALLQHAVKLELHGLLVLQERLQRRAWQRKRLTNLMWLTHMTGMP